MVVVFRQGQALGLLALRDEPRKEARQAVAELAALGVTSVRRAPSMPDVPSIAEAGVRDFDVSVWFGLLAPVGTPPEVVRKIHYDVIKVLSTPALIDRLAAEGLEVVTMQSAEFGSYLRSEVAKWSAVVKQANIKFD